MALNTTTETILSTSQALYETPYVHSITALGLYWFRRDLRLSDNPALYEAQRLQQYLLPIYIDDHSDHYAKLGAAARWWTADALQHLNRDLEDGLRIFTGSYAEVIIKVCQQYHIKNVYANRVYDPINQALELSLALILQQQGISLNLYNDELIDLERVAQKHRYQLFSAFYKTVMHLNEFCPVIPLPALKIFQSTKHGTVTTLSSTKNLHASWQTGESYAQRALEFFILFKLEQYEPKKDRPVMEANSHLSPFLACGNITLRTCFSQVVNQPHSQAFVRQLIWSEFARYILKVHPQMLHTNLRPQFNSYPWQFDQHKFDRWTKGETGFAFIDAAMRQLHSYGFINNRLRMNVASFLTKNLNIAWQFGERWFWEHLIDANLANNSLNWQWVAGTALNPSPFSRIFNPQRQMMLYDPDLHYIKLYLPEVEHYTMQQLQKPYRTPVVDFHQSRLEAIQNYQIMKAISHTPSK